MTVVALDNLKFAQYFTSFAESTADLFLTVTAGSSHPKMCADSNLI